MTRALTSIKDATEAANKERRERIATAALQGILSCPDTDGGPRASAKYAVAYADSLIAELDKEPKP